ncbi:urease accessory protein UreF [Devosia sp.]|uniref:urease accessory protein UreF n=1 Tax=Devosia sp. TaxID=1871048 RepID=UPI003A905007
MTNPLALQRLLTWLSPAFPVGSFAWSAGLETAIASGTVADAKILEDWVGAALHHGGIRTDAIILAAAYAAHDDTAKLAEIADLCLALTASKERHDELTITGAAFVKALAAWPSDVLQRLPDPCPYPLVVGAAAGDHDIGVTDTLRAFLTALVHAQVSVAVRLVPLGQTDGLTVMSALEPQIATLADFAAAASLEDLGSIGYAADIAQMRHETLEPRIFRS